MALRYAILGISAGGVPRWSSRRIDRRGRDQLMKGSFMDMLAKSIMTSLGERRCGAAPRRGARTRLKALPTTSAILLCFTAMARHR